MIKMRIILLVLFMRSWLASDNAITNNKIHLMTDRHEYRNKKSHVTAGSGTAMNENC